MQITWGEETHDVRRGKRDKIEVWQGDTHLFSLAHDFPVDLISEVCRVYGMGRSRGEYQRDRLHPSQTLTQPHQEDAMLNAKPLMGKSAPYSTLRTGNREYWGFSPWNWVSPKPGTWRNIPLSAVYWPSSTPSGLQSVLAADFPNGTLGDLADDVKHVVHQDGVGPRSFGLLLLLIERAAADIDVTKKHDALTEDEAAHFAQQARARWDAEHLHRRNR